jgi:hypothetical protein
VVWALWGEDFAYRHHLVKYDDDGGEPNRYFNLADGKAQLAIGSPDDHRLVVQWRDPDGSGWTDPESVWTDDTNIFLDTTVRYGHGTVAIIATYTPDTSEDNDIKSVSVEIVCHEFERACTADDRAGAIGEAPVTPDAGLSIWGETAARHTSGHMPGASIQRDGGDIRSPVSTILRSRRPNRC